MRAWDGYGIDMRLRRSTSVPCHTLSRHAHGMAQPPQTEAADGGTTIAIAPVPILHSCVRRRSSSMLMPSRRHTPRMLRIRCLRRHRRWKTSSRCSWGGVLGQDSAPYNRTESSKLPYIRVLVRVEMSLLRQSVAACCTAAPAAVSRQLISLSRLQSALK
jgi:hypothetical protein